MPHITIECSANVGSADTLDGLVDVVHRAALDDGFAALDALRTRVAPREHFRVANGDPRYAFVAITAHMAPGRSDDVKVRLLERLLDAAQGFLSARCDRAIAYSAEVTEIDPTARVNRNGVREHMSREAGGR